MVNKDLLRLLTCSAGDYINTKKGDFRAYDLIDLEGGGISWHDAKTAIKENAVKKGCEVITDRLHGEDYTIYGTGIKLKEDEKRDG